MAEIRRKLGKLPVRFDRRTLKLARYTAALAPAPEACDETAKITQLGMMGNDEVGDCTCATVGHMIQAWTAEDGAQVILPDSDILGMYSAITGYNASDPATDQGAAVLDVLNYWRKTGVDNHTITGYVSVAPANRDELEQAIYYFGACYIGVLLPWTAASQDIWSVPEQGARGDGAPGSWGGHAVPVVAYNETGPVCITWGQLKQMTWQFYYTYCDEAYACVSKDIVGDNDKSPEGFDFVQLQSDLASL
jgi:hypothetical protein